MNESIRSNENFQQQLSARATYPLGELHLDEFPAADYFLNFVFQLAGSRSVIC